MCDPYHTQVSMRYNTHMKNPVVAQKTEEFFIQFPLIHYKKGEVLIRAGEEPKGIYFLKQGHVRQYTITKNGEEITLNIYKPGAFFPMAWVVTDYSNVYTFESMDDSDVYVAPKVDILEFIKKEPDVLFDLLQRLYSGLEGVLSRMEHLMSGNARGRLMTILVISAKRFGDAQQDNVLINLKLTHQDLASMSGLTRETVSREMMALKQEGLIDYTNTLITIQNLKELEKNLL
jgi:CRP/FNR family cyclic AMP-dependent transcriptional regulator